MIASRLPADLSPNTFSRALDAMRARGADVIDLTVSNPTRVGFSYPADLLAPLASPEALVYDPHPRGLAAARAAVAADFARRGLVVDADRLALTASTSEAYALLFKLLCAAGDSVLVPQPSYPLFDQLTTLENVRPVPYRLDAHDGWRPDLDHLRRAADSGTRAVLVVSPNNPTGSFLHHDDLVPLAEFCASRRLVLIGDEVFADFPLDAAAPPASVLEAPETVTCSLGGLSKSVGLPQLKLGWIAFGGPAEPVRALVHAYEIIADAYLSVGTPVQTALPHLLERGAGIRDQIRQRIARNLAALRRAAADAPAVTVLPVEGGWSAVLQVPAVGSEESLVLDLLEIDHVLVHPGYFFDFEREAFVVVSLLVEPEAFDRGVARLLARATGAGGAS